MTTSVSVDEDPASRARERTQRGLRGVSRTLIDRDRFGERPGTSLCFEKKQVSILESRAEEVVVVDVLVRGLVRGRARAALGAAQQGVGRAAVGSERRHRPSLASRTLERALQRTSPLVSSVVLNAPESF